MRVFGTRRVGNALSLFPLSVHGRGRWHSPSVLSKRFYMGIMSSISRADVDTAVDAQELLDRLHATLAAVFKRHAQDGGGLRALSADDIAPLRALCDQLLPAHFKLQVPGPMDRTKASHQSTHGRRNHVGYQHICGNQLFSMGIFILPPGSSIPLHDHPDMSVISRVLYGRLHVISCDFASPKEADHLFRPHRHGSFPTSPTSSHASSTTRIARIFQDEVITAPHTTALLPDEGNLHEFVADAELGCAIFDILTPPYESDDGRDCTYYRVMSDTKTSKHGRAYVELEEFEPYDFEVVSEPYHGPRLLC